jgi:hypothetical protein
MEKTYNIKLTEKEMSNPRIKKRVLEILELRLKYRKHDKFMKISTAEYEMLQGHWSWVDVEQYEPDKKKRFKNEVGKYNGKRVVLR